VEALARDLADDLPPPSPPREPNEMDEVDLALAGR
jgi:hypothetical protein